MAKRKKCRWHIDYLTCRRDVCIESMRIFPVESMTECMLNARVQGLSDAKPIRRFGCSDCRCTSHLTYLGDSLLEMYHDKSLFNA